MRRALPILLAVAAVGGVVAYRLSTRSNGPQGIRLVRTGRTVPVAVGAVPAGLRVDGTFTCYELRVGGFYTAEAAGATLRNVSGVPLRPAFDFSATADGRTESVSRAFNMNPADTYSRFTMASKSIPKGLDACRIDFRLAAAAGSSPADLAALRRAAKAAGCTLADPPILGREHITPPARGRYNSTPPTSGQHYAHPADTGVHRDPIQNEFQVHNLEHGHIGIQYGSIPPALRDRLEAFANADPQWIFVAPYRGARFAVALTAWGHIAMCPSPGEKIPDLAKAFVRAYKDGGPESIPGTPA